MNMICDITNGLEANHGPILILHKCDVETYTANELFSGVVEILCPAVELLK